LGEIRLKSLSSGAKHGLHLKFSPAKRYIPDLIKIKISLIFSIANSSNFDSSNKKN
jgi:hypothetical protein